MDDLTCVTVWRRRCWLLTKLRRITFETEGVLLRDMIATNIGCKEAKLPEWSNYCMLLGNNLRIKRKLQYRRKTRWSKSCLVHLPALSSSHVRPNPRTMVGFPGRNLLPVVVSPGKNPSVVVFPWSRAVPSPRRRALSLRYGRRCWNIGPKSSGP
jgi:hypothetical protein